MCMNLSDLAMEMLVYFMARVTKLGEFSHNGRLFTLVNFLKIAEVAHIFVPTFLCPLHEYKGCINFDKKWFGLHFGRFF
jgi:hypothetical protein